MKEFFKKNRVPFKWATASTEINKLVRERKNKACLNNGSYLSSLSQKKSVLSLSTLLRRKDFLKNAGRGLLSSSQMSYNSVYLKLRLGFKLGHFINLLKLLKTELIGGYTIKLPNTPGCRKLAGENCLGCLLPLWILEGKPSNLWPVSVPCCWSSFS